MELQIPIQALTVNQAWQGRRFKSPAYRRFENEMRYLLKPAKETVMGPVLAVYEYGLPPMQFSHCDVGNMEKCLSDILVKLGYLEDDRKIIELRQKKVLAKDFYIKVCITPLALP